MAVEAFRDNVTITRKPGNGNVSVMETEKTFGERNTALTSVRKLVETQGVKDFDLSVSVAKNVPIGVGLGSSGASAAAAVFAANEVLDLNLTKAALVKYAAHGELSAAGAPHADNVSAALMGGFTCVFDASKNEIFSVRVPRSLRIVVLLIQGFDPEDKTRKAREALPADIQLSSAITQAASASKLVFAAARGDWKMFASAISSDLIVEKARSKIYPWFPSLKQRALELGALGCSLCGAGPSLFSVGLAEENKFSREDWLSRAKEEGLGCSLLETYVDNEGGRIESST